MSNTYGAPGGGGSFIDVISSIKNVAQNLGGVLQSISNAFPPPISTTSPVTTGINTLGTTGTSVIGTSATRHGIVFHNPSTTVFAFVYTLPIATTPTIAAPGGAYMIVPGATFPWPSFEYTNTNCGFGAFVSTGTTGPLTITEYF